ncbi:MAG: CCA tRNA nucleotidyltransferase [Alphaproteobacteria bacterium]
MEATRTIQVPDWMKTPEVRRVMSVLNEGGGAQARFVGGCVRNELLGLEVTDLDIATLWTPGEVTPKLEEAGIKVVPTGIDYGTITAVVDGKAFEITTLRKDVETDGRRAVVAYSKDWREDAQRRDFTMNTLLGDMEGHIYDPTGRGLADLAARRVIFVGDPAQRIAEDYLRILRFFRFHARYGKEAPDEAALRACGAAADKINMLSAERVSQEWFKILSVDDPVDSLLLMFENNILKYLIESKYQPELLRKVCSLQKEHDQCSLGARLWILGKIFDNKIIVLKALQRELESISQVISLPVMRDDHAIRVAVYKAGRATAAQGLLIEVAQDKIPEKTLAKALEITRGWEIPKMPVSGEDLKKAGIAEGPELGQKLAAIESWWIEQDFKPGRTECLERI